MARFLDKQKALELRKQGMSYGQIKEELGVSKSTLSSWLQGFPLSTQRINELRRHNDRKIERYRETMRKKREERLLRTYENEKKDILPLSKKEFFLFGLGLYWGEGSKGNSRLTISNTDPSIIRFFINWLNKSLNIPKEHLKIHLQLYKDMNIQNEINFWGTTSGIPKKQFCRPYIKESSIKSINHKGGFGHGTCNVYIGSARLFEKILMAIKAISNEYATRT